MENSLYLVFDKVAETCTGGIIRVRNDEVARRSFYEALAAKDSPLAAHPGDYVLLKVGQINEITALIEGQSINTQVASGQDWLDANKGA